jgi:trimethylamine--corrinoid protein Co-methyltransferase
MSHVNIVWGIGNLESTKCISPEMAVIGNDIAGALKRAQAGIRVSDETLAGHIIRDLGRRAEYLEHPHTLEHFKQEYYFPRVTNRRARSAWEASGRPSILMNARERIKDLKNLPLRSIVTPAQQREMLKIEKKWTQELT